MSIKLKSSNQIGAGEETHDTGIGWPKLILVKHNDINSCKAQVDGGETWDPNSSKPKLVLEKAFKVSIWFSSHNNTSFQWLISINSRIFLWRAYLSSNTLFNRQSLFHGYMLFVEANQCGASMATICKEVIGLFWFKQRVHMSIVVAQQMQLAYTFLVKTKLL